MALNTIDTPPPQGAVPMSTEDFLKEVLKWGETDTHPAAWVGGYRYSQEHQSWIVHQLMWHRGKLRWLGSPGPPSSTTTFEEFQEKYDGLWWMVE